MTGVFLLLCGLVAQGAAVPAEEEMLHRAEELAWSRQFAMSEKIYRDALERFGPSRRQQLGLGRALLWQGDYDAARREFVQLLVQQPADPDALEGLAQAAYWSGDYRQAQRVFEQLTGVIPDHAVALKSLHEIASASRPLAQARLSYLHDDQPYAILGSDLSVVLSSDPLTRWTAELKTSRLEDQSAGIEEQSWSAGGKSTFRIPRWSMEVDAGARMVSFPDDEQRLLGHLSVSYEPRKFWNTAVSWEQRELLSTATSLDSSVYVTTRAFNVGYEGAWSSSATARQLRYSDGNSGESADIWGLVPLIRRNESSISAGVSVAWKDTRDNRFQFTRAESSPVGDVFHYRFRGVYDPYWTPHELLDARIVLAGVLKAPADTWVRFHLDGGWARDQAITFAPPVGSTPLPQFTFPFLFAREFHPWFAEAEITIPIGATRLKAAYRHRVTVFYSADEYQASLVRSF